jgi:predicted hydrocarbon binding protein
MASSGYSKPPFSRLFEGRSRRLDPGSGIAQVPDGTRVVFAAAPFLWATNRVLDTEKPGAWSAIFHQGGVAAGRSFAISVDLELTRLGQPVLTDQPLDACFVLAERHFAAQGWGVLVPDLSDAPEHGLVIARMKQSSFVAALGDGTGFADALPAGFLQGFLEYVSGQPLGCLEIGCARMGAPQCTFVITSSERLDPIRPLLGLKAADEIIALLKS